MNVDRMRRNLQRGIDASAELELARLREARQAWIDTLPPEHRRIHEGPWAAACGICMREGARKVGETIALGLRRMAEANASVRDTPNG